MVGRKLGKSWETVARHILMEDFNTHLVLRPHNVDVIDFLIFIKSHPAKKIALVETKDTKKDRYYALDEEKKRKQWKAYFQMKSDLEQLGYNVQVWLYLRKKKEISKHKLERYEDIKTRY